MPPKPEDLHDQIKEIIIDRLFLEVAPSELASGESLTEEYGVDSVRLFDMVVGLEEDFDISFEDDELTINNFDSVATIAEQVCDKMIG